MGLVGSPVPTSRNWRIPSSRRNCIGQTYAQEWGGPEGTLGFPTSGEFAVGSDGRLNSFEREDSGLLYAPATGVSLIAEASLFGLIAERLIHDDYCSVMAGCNPTHAYFDRTASPQEYLVFLQSHNLGLTGYMTKFGLPYVSGVAYTPTPFIPMGTEQVPGATVTVELGVSRRIPALVDYMLCIKGPLAQIIAAIGLAAVVALIMAEIVAQFAPLLLV